MYVLFLFDSTTIVKDAKIKYRLFQRTLTFSRIFRYNIRAAILNIYGEKIESNFILILYQKRANVGNTRDMQTINRVRNSTGFLSSSFSFLCKNKTLFSSVAVTKNKSNLDYGLDIKSGKQ